MNEQLKNVMHLLCKRKGIYVPDNPQFLFWINGSASAGYICLFCNYKFPLIPIVNSHKDVMKMLEDHSALHVKEHNLLAML